MTKVSRRPLSVEKQRNIEKEFWDVIARLKSAREVRMFLRDVLTYTEIKMVVKRLQIARKLVEFCSYSEIEEDLHVTDVTIAKVSNRLHTAGAGFRLALKRIKH